MEEAGLLLNNGLSILKKVQRKINSIPGEKGIVLQEKLNAVLSRKPDLTKLQRVDEVLCGEEVALPEGMNPADVAMLNYCPITSVDVERSFSQYKNIPASEVHHGQFV